MTLANILAESGQSEKVLIYTLIGGHIVTLVVMLIKALIDQANRVQDRLDAESKAKIILAAGADREARIRADIEANTKVNETALEVSNGHTAKLTSALATMADVTKAIEGGAPKEIHVTVDGGK